MSTSFMPPQNQSASHADNSSAFDQDLDSFLPPVSPPSHRQQVRYEAEDQYATEPTAALQNEVRSAQDRLESLRREQEELERRKQELEELNDKRTRFHDGRQNVIEQMSRMTAKLERMADEAERRADTMRNASETYRKHLGIMDTLRPEEWSKDQLHEELDRALDLISAADADYGRESRRLEGMTNEDGKGGFSVNEQPFYYWLRSGFAFTLPVLALGLIGLILVLTAIAGAE